MKYIQLFESYNFENKIINDIDKLKKEYNIKNILISFKDLNKNVSFEYKNGEMGYDSKFIAQSVSKTHVKLMILSLIENGILNLSDNIFKQLDRYIKHCTLLNILYFCVVLFYTMLTATYE